MKLNQCQIPVIELSCRRCPSATDSVNGCRFRINYEMLCRNPKNLNIDINACCKYSIQVIRSHQRQILVIGGCRFICRLSIRNWLLNICLYQSSSKLDVALMRIQQKGHEIKLKLKYQWLRCLTSCRFIFQEPIQN